MTRRPIPRPVKIFLLVCYGLAAIFLIWPEIDLAVASIYFDPTVYAGTGFPAGYDERMLAIHRGVRMLGIALGSVLLLAFVIHLVARRGRWNRNGRVLAFLLAALVVGPVLLVNVVLKDNWGRARPYQISEFGRDKAFTPAFVLSDQCGRNCSFVSGDVSIAFYFTAFAMVARHRRNRRRIFAGAVAFGVVVAWLRIVHGAHFLSDVTFAALFTLAVNWLLCRLIVVRRGADFARLWRRLRPRRVSDDVARAAR